MLHPVGMHPDGMRNPHKTTAAGSRHGRSECSEAESRDLPTNPSTFPQPCFALPDVSETFPQPCFALPQRFGTDRTKERLNNCLFSRSSVPSCKIAFPFGKAQDLQENLSFSTIQSEEDKQITNP
jgi:hypothetical protein